MVKNLVVTVSFVCGVSAAAMSVNVSSSTNLEETMGSVIIKSHPTNRILPEGWNLNTFWETTQDTESGSSDCNAVTSNDEVYGTTFVNNNAQSLRENNLLLTGRTKLPTKPKKTETMKQRARDEALKLIDNGVDLTLIKQKQPVTDWIEFFKHESKNIDYNITSFFKKPEDKAMDAMNGLYAMAQVIRGAAESLGYKDQITKDLEAQIEDLDIECEIYKQMHELDEMMLEVNAKKLAINVEKALGSVDEIETRLDNQLYLQNLKTIIDDARIEQLEEAYNELYPTNSLHDTDPQIEFDKALEELKNLVDSTKPNHVVSAESNNNATAAAPQPKKKVGIMDVVRNDISDLNNYIVKGVQNLFGKTKNLFKKAK